MNNLEKYIGDLNPTCWFDTTALKSDGSTFVNDDVINQFYNKAEITAHNGVFDITGTTAPTFKIGGQNNQPYLDFVAANLNAIRIPTVVSPYGVGERTVVIVYQTLSNQGIHVLQHQFGGAQAGNMTILATLNPQIATYDPAGTQRTGNVLAPHRLHVVIFSQKNGGSYNLFRVDNRVNLMPVPCTVNPDYTSSPNPGMSLGVRYDGSSKNPNSAYTNYRFYEMIVFNKQLFLPQVSQVQTYIKLKYNI